MPRLGNIVKLPHSPVLHMPNIRKIDDFIITLSPSIIILELKSPKIATKTPKKSGLF